MKEINCGHYKGTGYHYVINDKEKLNLCNECNKNLAQEILKQMANEVFSNNY